MSLHPSLRQGGKSGFFRTVLSRTERIKDLITKGKWKQEKSIFGLPKTKIVRMKAAKKSKKQEDAEKKEAETKTATPPPPAK